MANNAQILDPLEVWKVLLFFFSKFTTPSVGEGYGLRVTVKQKTTPGVHHQVDTTNTGKKSNCALGAQEEKSAIEPPPRFALHTAIQMRKRCETVRKTQPTFCHQHWVSGFNRCKWFKMAYNEDNCCSNNLP